VENNNSEDYSKYTIYQLYDAYYKIDYTKSPLDYTQVINEIRKRFNIPETEVINNSYIENLYSKYHHSESRPQFSNLAAAGNRFLAKILDGLFILSPLIIIAFLSGENKVFVPVAGFGMQQLAKLLMVLLLYLLLNGYLLYSYGQTIGKKIVGIKIVTLENEVPPFSHIYFLRYLVPSILFSAPFLGLIFFIIDSLFIFREDKRCIHDLLAGTKVVNA